MRHSLVLSLAADHLVLELVRSDRVGLGQALHRLLRHRHAPGGSGSAVARVQVAGNTGPDQLPLLLDKALAEIEALHGQALSDASLDVQLGLDHAFIGLVDLSGIPRDLQSMGNCDTYASAWVTQMLHQDAAAALVRWQLLDHPRKLLVSCVAQRLVATLTGFCLQRSLGFSSCRPAVFTALDRRPSGAGGANRNSALDLAWTETSAQGDRSSTLQLLRLQGRQLSALWRGWVPSSRTSGAGDIALDEAIARFRRLSPSASPGVVERVFWPTPVNASVTG